MVVQKRILERLKEAFSPTHLEVVNESGNHSVPPGSESHFNALVVSQAFEGQSRVQRQRAVYAAIGEELASGVHAFAMRTLTPSEWESERTVRQSPDCRGGAKAEGLFD